MTYRNAIEALGLGSDARHVEAFMRSERGTLDALSPRQFAAEARAAAACVAADPALAEQLAQSYGLVRTP